MQIPVSRELSRWRSTARGLLAAEVAPDAVTWVPVAGDQASLPLGAEPAAQVGPERHGAGPHAAASPEDRDRLGATALRISRDFLDLARRVLCHRDERVFALLYATVWRMAHGERSLLAIAIDPLVRELALKDREVRRDAHKMKAFVRFREVQDGAGSTHFAAWFEPSHFIVPLTAAFFRDRFAQMDWSILTPDQCVSWAGSELHFAPGIRRPESLAPDRLDDAWRTYYANIFNPARLKIAAMKKEMPVRYWRNLPEAQLIAPLIAAAGTRVDAMMMRSPTPARRDAATVLPDGPAPPLVERIRGCTACPLHDRATQAVPGAGSSVADIVIVGEQPGDEEDLAGEPFVGPAGRVLRRAMSAAGLEEERVFLTNVVKHFSWLPRGKRRLHKTPGEREILACRPWLQEELAALAPRVVVCLGSTASAALLPPGASGLNRGEPFHAPNGRWFIHTFHPAYVLRTKDGEASRVQAALVQALRIARELCEAAPAPHCSTPRPSG